MSKRLSLAGLSAKVRSKKRLNRGRPGSILILVIALLVLMALIGTAFISTAHIERYSATQNTYNTQIDLFSRGLLDQAEGAMLHKLQGSNGIFRQASGSGATTPGAYFPWESLITDTYLADRVPGPWLMQVPLNPAQPAIPVTLPVDGFSTGISSAGANPIFPIWAPTDPSLGGTSPTSPLFPFWMYITAPMNASSANPSGVFEAPYAVDWNGAQVQGPITYTARQQVLPWAIPVPQPDGSKKLFPAFVVKPINPNPLLIDGKTHAVLPIVVLAADTDGDGIADAGLMRLSGGQVDGATYYGAVRIIDNAAAFNASVAYGINTQSTNYPNAVPGDFFPTNVNLQDMLSDSITPLNAFRFNNGAASLQPIDDLGNKHTDYSFNTPYEALWTQLGIRLNNPGYNASTTNKYQAVPISDGINLASHFCLKNQNIASTTPPTLETLIPNSIAGPMSNQTPYAPGNVGPWFQEQFNYDPNAATNSPIKSILVARNPVSDFVPSWFNDQGIYGMPLTGGAAIYQFGDRVQTRDPNAGDNMRGFVCIQPHPAGSQAPMNGSAYNNAYWAAMPWASHPTRINANTGTFGQLWTAYWSVMQDSPDSTLAYPRIGNAGYNWQSNGQIDTDPPPNADSNTLAHQFRSSIRSTTGTFLTRTQMIQLRSALAAVNTIDMRDGDTDITSRTIALTPATVTKQTPVVYANVYGAERQPYFSALLIDYHPRDGSPNAGAPYVVVELYNPHPVPIGLTGWKLASLTRSGGSITLTEVSDLYTTLRTASHAGGLTGAVIMPGERIVLENNPALQPDNIKTDWGTNKVTSYTNQSPTTGANLDAAVGNELVLLRPRHTGTLGAKPPKVAASNAAPENSYDEKSLMDLVPLDNLDMVGVAAPTGTPPQPQRYRYARANLITKDYLSAAWHCVYPGPYNLGAPFHHVGLLSVPADGPDADNGNFGRANGLLAGAPTGAIGSDLSAYATYETRPLKINSLDLAGPNRPYAEALKGGLPNGSVKQFAAGKPMSFPLGGFARRGDLLEVPFIGSYVLSSTPDPSAGGAKVYEMNSVTMDSVYAQFQPPSTNIPLQSSYDKDMSYVNGLYPQWVYLPLCFYYIPQGYRFPPPYPQPISPPGRYPLQYPLPVFHNEQIGHFCPMNYGSNDFNDDPADANFSTNMKSWTYHWAKQLYDYVDVSTPQDAYFPNVDPSVTTSNVSGDPSVKGSPVKYPGVNPTPLPVPISSSPSLTIKTGKGQTLVQQLQGLQDTAGSEGQINVNTASWKVLSGIPFFTPDMDSYYAVDNIEMASGIWNWREWQSGAAASPHPYRSIFDIMKISGGPFYTIGQRMTLWQVYQLIWTTTSSYDGGSSDIFTVFSSPGETINQYGSLSPYAATFPTPASEAPKYSTPVLIPPTPTAPNPPDGWPPYPTPLATEADLADHVYGDVKARFLGFTRISNLITTRSDSFTAYIQVQAWQNIGTPTPTLVATHRTAALLDRTQVKPMRNATSNTVWQTPIGETNVPND